MNPDDVYRQYMTAGNKWADASGAADLLETSLKSLKAKLAIQAKSRQGCSMAEATELALADDAYRKAAEDAVEARLQANRAKVGYDACKALFEARRTAAATERAAMGAAT